MGSFDYEVRELRRCHERALQMLEADERDELRRCLIDGMQCTWRALEALAEHSSMPREVPER